MVICDDGNYGSSWRKFLFYERSIEFWLIELVGVVFSYFQWILEHPKVLELPFVEALQMGDQKDGFFGGFMLGFGLLKLGRPGCHKNRKGVDVGHLVPRAP